MVEVGKYDLVINGDQVLEHKEKILSLLDSYDFHTEYIDDLNQSRSAEKRNNEIRNRLNAIGVTDFYLRK